MRSLNLSHRLKFGALGLALSALLAASGCSSALRPISIGQQQRPAPEEAAEAAHVEAEPAGVFVESINVVGDGDRVLIETSGHVRYTVFKLTDPTRLIVDLPDVGLRDFEHGIDVDNYFISRISAESHDGDETISRVIIGLKEGIDHDVQSGENSILVSLSEDMYNGGEPAGMEAEVAVVEEDLEDNLAAEAFMMEEAPAEAPPVVVELAPEEPAVPAVPARNVTGVDVSVEGAHSEVDIVADGAIGSYNSFELADPSRIVVDVAGLDNKTGMNVVKVGGEHVKAVRIGRHPDKTRFVFDAVDGGMPPYQISKAGDRLTLRFGENGLGQGPAAAVKKEPVMAASAPEEAAPAMAEEAGMMAAATAPPSPAAPAAAAPAMEGQIMDEGKAVESPAMAAKAPEPVKPASVEIQDVLFKKVGLGEAAKGRLTIRGAEPVKYVFKESEDKRTVILDLKGARIPERLTRTLDATRLATPVGTISSYQESVDPDEVRVLIRLKDKAVYDIDEADGLLKVSFSAPPSAPSAEEVAEKAAEAEKAAKAEEMMLPEKKYTGKRIDLDMMDANISDVLRLLAEISNLNIIASDDVRGTISLRLKNVPWDQAFDIVLKSKGLDKIMEGNVVRVAPAEKIRQEKEAKLAAMKAQEKLETLEIRYVPINYANADELEAQVKNVLSDRGSVTSEARTNTLIIKDIQAGLESAEDLITKLDTPIPQVLIEARIVEASTSFARDLGIQWGVDYQAGGSTTTTDTFGSTSTSGQTPPSATTTPPFATRHGAGSYAVDLPATGTAGTLGALGFILGRAGNNPLILDLRLSAGEQEGRLRTISRPRIITMDNKEAKIEQGESIPFETVSASGTATTFIDANLSLTVTPHITPDGSVLMKIKASRNSIGTFRTSSGEPSINKKEASTEVLVSDGETTVIGGIVVSDKSETDKGVPFLKEIPLLGWLFKSKSQSDSQTELLIFITPTIIKDKVVG